MEQDALIEDVRDARRQISAECSGDIWKLFSHYTAIQNKMREIGNYSFLSNSNMASDANQAAAAVSSPH
ncbi:MAG: hypothetical protein NTX50_04260 [Candidatus Sumerlaeota bacterium]|nr:hypothetical protein [Candidatus Sumerlaeota bacterium]